MQTLPQSNILNDISFWVVLTGSILSGYALFVIKSIKKDIDELFSRSREFERKYAEHLGYHKGLEKKDE